MVYGRVACLLVMAMLLQQPEWADAYRGMVASAPVSGNWAGQVNLNNSPNKFLPPVELMWEDMPALLEVVAPSETLAWKQTVNLLVVSTVKGTDSIRELQDMALAVVSATKKHAHMDDSVVTPLVNAVKSCERDARGDRAKFATCLRRDGIVPVIKKAMGIAKCKPVAGAAAPPAGGPGGAGMRVAAACALSTFDCDAASTEGLDEAECACKCKGKWTGTYCRQCSLTAESCSNGAKLDTETCTCTGCPAPWAGELCGKCGLKIADCLHDGVLKVADCACECKIQWGGNRCGECKIEMSHCEHSKALKTGGECACACDPAADWEGSFCSICKHQPDACKNGGELDQTTCTCVGCGAGWGGQFCNECTRTDLDCKNGSQIDATTCKCTVGCPANFSGDLCGECVLSNDDCSPNCKTADVETCSCKDPVDPSYAGRWGGETCSKCLYVQDNCKSGKFNPATCVCEGCEDRWDGVLCDHCTWESIKDCSAGQGVLQTDKCMCACRPGFEGDHCEKCVWSQANCAHGKFDATSCGCDCEAGVWRDRTCSICIRDPLDCQHGSSLDLEVCSCHKDCNDPWTGPRCDTCAVGLTPATSCQHGGGKSMTDCACNCSGGWESTYCEKCGLSTADCKNGGALNTVTCQCDCVAPWSGRLCSSCPPDAGNKCTALGVGFDMVGCKCSTCPGGWKGDFCDVCGLTSAMCGHPNAGNPIDVAGCKCNCAGNWSGPKCDVCPPTAPAGACPAGNSWDAGTCGCKCMAVMPRAGGNTFQINIALILDLTGSMGSWVASARKSFSNTSNVISASLAATCGSDIRLNVNMAAVGYRDKWDRPRFQSTPGFQSPAQVNTFIDKWYASGGGDGPEDVEGAFHLAADLDWSKGDINFAVFAADAPCHGAWGGGYGGVEYVPSVMDGVAKLKQKSVILMGIKINSYPNAMFNNLRAGYDGAASPVSPTSHLLHYHNVDIAPSQLQKAVQDIVTNALTLPA